MTRQEFINKIAPLIVKYASQYNILCPSAVIAQAVLESDGGNSELALNAHNYFGLKYRANRCPSACGIYYKNGSEQNPDGSYTTSAMQWMKFASMEDGVRGYFDFINISNYANVKGVADPKKYLENIKADGYATSLNYVDNVYQVIQRYNLTRFDKKEEIKMSYKVAIDAGHGSNTAGKRTVTGYREHWCNVKTANYFDIAMKRCGIETVRIAWDDTNATDDTDVALGTRQIQIKNANCDISVSWHANAHGDGKTYTSGQGIETLIHNNSARVGDSKALADKVQAQLIKGTSQKNRGVKAMSLAMCNCEAMSTKASILIEIGFMTNQYEEQLIQTDAFCLECAEEAAKGVCEYLGVIYKPNNGSYVPTPNPTTSTSPTRSYLMKGDKGTDVKTLQENLNYLGYNCGNADGDFGVKTDTALRNFQKAYKLTVDGKYGATSKKTLEDAVSKKKNATTPAPSTSTTTSTTVPLKITQSKKAIQEFLNTYYGTEIKRVLGSLLVVDGAIGNKSKLALGIAIQVELNKLGAGLVVDGKIGANSANAWNKYVGTLKSGSKGIFVTLWQCILVANNLNPNGIDGAFGNGCKSATDQLFLKIGLTKDSSVAGSDVNALL